MSKHYFQQDLRIAVSDNYANSEFLNCRLELDFELFERGRKQLTPEAASVFGGSVRMEGCIINTPEGRAAK